MKSLRNIVLAAALACGIGACGDDDGGNNNYNNNNNNNGSNPIAVINSATITPADNSVVTGPFDYGFTVPAVDDSYTGAVEGEIVVTGDNGTPANTADDRSETLYSQTVTEGQSVSGNADPSTLFGTGAKNGEKLTLEYIVTATSAPEPNSQSATRTVTYENVTKPVRVTDCYVTNSSVGASLNIRCYGESDNGSVTGWNLTGGPDGAIITGSGTISAPAMDVSDVGLHTYAVTCTDGADTSDAYSFTVPVDTHRSTLTLHCSSGTDNIMLLPETSVDAVATACGAGFNPSLKPADGQPDYILDVTPSCVQGAINALSADEKAAQKHYNGGTTIDDVYSNCTVDFAQVKYQG